MRTFPAAACFFFIPVGVACASAHEPLGTGQTGVTASDANLHVSVALASTYLGAEGCTHDESGSLKVMSCAVPSDAGPQGTGPCGGPCDFSSVHLAFTYDTSAATRHVQITKVALLDASTEMELQALSAYTPLMWNGTQYVAWDETLMPSSTTKARYTLAPPAWSTLGPSFSYSHQYEVLITIVVDGVTLMLKSPPLTRPPVLST